MTKDKAKIAAEIGRLMGESLARGADRYNRERMELLLLEFTLLDLELSIFLGSQKRRAHPGFRQLV